MENLKATKNKIDESVNADDDIYIDSKWQQQLTQIFNIGKKHIEKLPPIAHLCRLTGFAKTAETRAWLTHYNINNVYVCAGVRGVTHLEEENINVIFSTEEIDKMGEKDVVIVIDDYDWAKLSVRRELLNLIRFCRVVDLREKDNGYIKNLTNVAMIVILTHPDESPFSEPYTDIENALLGEKI